MYSVNHQAKGVLGILLDIHQMACLFIILQVWMIGKCCVHLCHSCFTGSALQRASELNFSSHVKYFLKTVLKEKDSRHLFYFLCINLVSLLMLLIYIYTRFKQTKNLPNTNFIYLGICVCWIVLWNMEQQFRINIG